ncbi:MAG: hypothetical protein WDW38_003411 [Sanguina aurantia]
MSKTPSKSRASTVHELAGGATEKVLKQIADLYDIGLTTGPGGMGLKAIAESPLLGLTLRKPRKKISVLIVGNHSAGKSSWINWYIGEQIQRTGVAIETRGFTFVTSGKKRETLQGEATLRFFEHLQGLETFTGIMPNIFTEISTSKDKNFTVCDFIDSPGLVDGDMQYPFDVQEAILWLADHADLILIFFDPIGQATCKRTMNVVEKLNNSKHLEKISYYMSKADAVEKEHDRQKVLIQITQNLATKIRNSHAFNLPTFYLPRDDDVPCNIPNAINDVCMDIDKAVKAGVQKNLRQLKADCQNILTRADDVLLEDKRKKASNLKRNLQGVLLVLCTLAALAATLSVPGLLGFEHVCNLPSRDGLPVCSSPTGTFALRLAPAILQHWTQIMGATTGALLTLLLTTYFVWRTVPVFSSKDIKRVGEFKAYVRKIAEQEKGLYEVYFKSLSNENE